MRAMVHVHFGLAVIVAAIKRAGYAPARVTDAVVSAAEINVRRTNPLLPPCRWKTLNSRRDRIVVDAQGRIGIALPRAQKPAPGRQYRSRATAVHV